MISHRFSIEDAAQAYELITGKRKEPFLGVLLTYPQHALPSGHDNRIPGPNAAVITLRPGEMLALGVLGQVILPMRFSCRPYGEPVVLPRPALPLLPG